MLNLLGHHGAACVDGITVSINLWWLSTTSRGCNQKGPLPKANHTHPLSGFRLLAPRLQISTVITVVRHHCMPNNLSLWDAKRTRHLHQATQPRICHVSSGVADIFTLDEENKGECLAEEDTPHMYLSPPLPGTPTPVLPSYFLVVTRNGVNRMGNIQLS